MLRKLTAGQQPKNNNKPGNKPKPGKPTTVVVASTSGNSQQQRKRRRRRRRNRGSRNPITAINGKPDLTLSRKDLVKQVSVATNSVGDYYQLQLDQLGFAKTFKDVFERYYISRAVAYYVPSVGANTDGVIIMGVDIDGQAHKASDSFNAEKVALLKSVVSSPVTKGFSINLPVRHGDGATDVKSEILQLVWHNSTKKPVGNLWIDYTVHFYGPKSA